MNKRIQLTLIILILSGGMLFVSCNLFKHAEKKQNLALQGKKSTGVVNPAEVEKPSKKPKKFSDLIGAKMVSDSGLFNIYKQDNKYLLEIADSLLNRDVLIVSRIAKSAAENRNSMHMLGYGGDQINENVIRFKNGPDSKLFIEKISYGERAGDSTKSMYKAVANSNIQPIVASFEVKGYSKREDGVIIDISDYLNGDNDILFFDDEPKKALRLGMLQGDKSYIIQTKSYPTNIEVKTTKTYVKNGESPEPGMPPVGGGFATYELNTSIIMLPKNQMKVRNEDDRIGYFSTSYTDFETNSQGIKRVAMISRWRIEPKPQDRQKYLGGELVEPIKQIVFYIDPATPKQWVPYLIQGVNDWNVAFEQAGFKNAILAKEAPTKAQDSTWSLDDARHSAIVYKSSDIPNASGPNVNDPRTGEILETHVNWYHNVMSILKNWYLIQAGAIDPKSRKMELDEELMGQLIRFVSSHEVGHTLGLAHNFGSSSTVPVDSLRNKAWVEANGHTPSIMDYARFNYVAQPEDHISEKGIFPRINDYDKWAIEWGYRWFAPESPEEEEERMNKWVIQKTSKNKRLWYGVQSMSQDDPRSQSEDLGDNTVKANSYGIKNLKRILPNLLDWTRVPNQDYVNTYKLYWELLGQYQRYMMHVAKNVGGVLNTPKRVEESGPVIEYLIKERQKEAMVFLEKQLFTTPDWLLNNRILEKIGGNRAEIVSKQQDRILRTLFSASTMNNLLAFEAQDPSRSYKPGEMLNDLQNSIFSELDKGETITIYRRNLQKMYTDKLLAILNPKTPEVATNSNDISSVIKRQLRQLDIKLKQELLKNTSSMRKAHLQDLHDRIQGYFKK